MAKRWHLTFNDRSQTIQGYHVKDHNRYQDIKASVLSKKFEDWRPNYADIMLLDESYKYHNPIINLLMPVFLCEQHEKLRKQALKDFK